MARRFLMPLCALLLLAAAAPAAAQLVAPPVPARVVHAGQTLELVGRATRQSLWVDLYSVALYLPEPRRDAAYVAQPTVAKAFRVEVLYDGELPDRIPEDWADELLPPLEPAERAELRQAYRRLSQGDVLLFVFAPGSGTAMTLNGEPVLSRVDGGFMDGIVDLFLGPAAVSPRLRTALLSGD